MSRNLNLTTMSKLLMIKLVLSLLFISPSVFSQYRRGYPSADRVKVKANGLRIHTDGYRNNLVQVRREVERQNGYYSLNGLKLKAVSVNIENLSRYGRRLTPSESVDLLINGRLVRTYKEVVIPHYGLASRKVILRLPEYGSIHRDIIDRDIRSIELQVRGQRLITKLVVIGERPHIYRPRPRPYPRPTPRPTPRPRPRSRR